MLALTDRIRFYHYNSLKEVDRVKLKIEIQLNSVLTNLVINEHSVITNRFLSQIGHFSVQINPVIINKNDRSGVFVII